VSNRHGLSHIGYRIGAYADISRVLLRNLIRRRGWAPVDATAGGRSGIALLEGRRSWGDYLTFYQELYANEGPISEPPSGGRASPNWCGCWDTVCRRRWAATPPLLLKSRATSRSLFRRVFRSSGGRSLPKPADFETTTQAIAYPMAEPVQPVPGSKHSLHHSRYDGIYVYAPDQFLNADRPPRSKIAC